MDDITNEKIKEYSFLKDMYQDDHFPDFLVDKGKEILITLCKKIEKKKPGSVKKLYKLTHSATIKFNKLNEEFYAHDSETETAARECIAEDFEYISQAYGFEADIEKLIQNRDW